MSLIFRDQWRAAAQHILDTTPLGGALDRLDVVDDDGTILTIYTPMNPLLSTGEIRLLRFLESLAGRGYTDLYALLNGGVDADCRRSIAEAVAIAAGVDELAVS